MITLPYACSIEMPIDDNVSKITGYFMGHEEFNALFKWHWPLFVLFCCVLATGLYNSPYSTQSHPAAKTQTYRPLSKSHSDNGTDTFKDAAPPAPPPQVPPPVPPLRPRDRTSTEK